MRSQAAPDQAAVDAKQAEVDKLGTEIGKLYDAYSKIETGVNRQNEIEENEKER
jgi:hypothetical protein